MLDNYALPPRPAMVAQEPAQPNIALPQGEPWLSDPAVIAALGKAWTASGNGMATREGTVVLYNNPDGTIRPVHLPITNDHKTYKVKLEPNAAAILHTHSNRDAFRPSDGDRAEADRVRIPIYTLTRQGMYRYDPNTKKTELVRQGLTWLDKPKP